MKVTKINVVEKWNEIKKYLNSKTHDTFEAFEPEDFTDPEMQDLVEPFINNVNKQLANVDEPKEPKKKAKSDDSKVKKETKSTPKKETKKSDTTKKSTKSDTKKSSKTEKKSTKEKFGEKPYWYSIIETYVKSFEGKEKQQWRVRAFVKAINQACNAKLGQKTPNIGIIRDIRNELIDLANDVDEKKVSVPSNSDLRSSCKEALKKYSITKTIAKPDLKKEGLSGCDSSCVKKKKK